MSSQLPSFPDRRLVVSDAGVTDLPRYDGGEDPILDIFIGKS